MNKLIVALGALTASADQVEDLQDLLGFIQTNPRRVAIRDWLNDKPEPQAIHTVLDVIAADPVGRIPPILSLLGIVQQAEATAAALAAGDVPATLKSVPAAVTTTTPASVPASSTPASAAIAPAQGDSSVPAQGSSSAPASAAIAPASIPGSSPPASAAIAPAQGDSSAPAPGSAAAASGVCTTCTGTGLTDGGNSQCATCKGTGQQPAAQ